MIAAIDRTRVLNEWGSVLSTLPWHVFTLGPNDLYCEIIQRS